MDLLFNTSYKALLIKDVKDWVDWDTVNKEFENLTWVANVKNTVSKEMNFLDQSCYTDFKQKIIQECKGFLDNTLFLQGMYEDLVVTNSWGNITEPKHSHHEHIHPFSILSGVIYLDDNPGNLNLHVESYMPEVPHFLPATKHYAKLENLLKDAQIDAASINNLKHHMILFLSNSHHFVSEVAENLPNRRSIAFNTFWKGRIGVKEELGSHVF